jgi:hypothetical protein
MIWLIALVPAVLVFVITAASRSRKAWFWSTLCGLGVALLGYSTYFLMDAAAVLVASYLARKSVDFEQPEKPGEQWATAQRDAPRQTRPIISSGRAHVAEDNFVGVSAAEGVDVYAAQTPKPEQPSGMELADLREKIQAEHINPQVREKIKNYLEYLLNRSDNYNQNTIVFP